MTHSRGFTSGYLLRAAKAAKNNFNTSSNQIFMNNPIQLYTPRLTMIAATLEHVRIELEAPEQLSTLLDAQVSSAWPTGEYDRDAMEFFRARLEEGGTAVEGWYGW